MNLEILSKEQKYLEKISGYLGGLLKGKTNGRVVDSF